MPRQACKAEREEDTDMKEHYLLVAAASGDEDAAERSLAELSLLLETAGGSTDGMLIQNLPHPEPATYLGSGKVRELKMMADAYGSDGVVCDDELTPVQLQNLSELLDCKVLDRTTLILDIFAAHASTKEGKVQVEMAQLKYRLSHLKGVGKSLSRLGGGIGTRGPGETKLETDRRAIHRRIAALSREIQSMKQVRETTRKKRSKGAFPTAAIVGYTNAGKSTLLNRITRSDVLAEDKLFATLDPATRICALPDGEEVLFTDTVGFINKLPHTLIDAFRSTLEEAGYADLIIHVVDGADENAELHMDVVYKTLSELGISGKPVITLFNKSDLMAGSARLHDGRAEKTIRISAKTGEGIGEFYAALQQLLQESREYVDTVIPYQEGGRLNRIRRYGHLLSEEYVPEGIHITAYVPRSLLREDG